jgi:Flp pilus assembly protein protease CpaA
MPYVNAAIMLAAAAVLLYVSLTDIRERRIPNKVMLPALGLALLIALARPERWWLLLGGLAAGVLLLIPVFIYGLERAGGGDVKLALFVGLLLGWPTVVSALLVAFMSAGLFGIGAILLGRLSRRSAVAFAPFLALGTLVTAVFGLHLLPVT